MTKKYYEARLCLFLGWFATIDSRKIEESDRWAELLSADNCRDYLNWLVSRSGNGHLNPGHPAFLRMVRGLHRFLLGSSSTTIDEFNDLAKRCDVVGRDKSARMVPYADLERGLRTALEAVTKKREGVVGKSKASLQVDVIILGLLTTRGLRSLNIREIRIGCNLVETADGFLLRYSEAEMKGHRAFETTIPAEIAQIIKDYLRTGYAKLANRPACEGDHLLLTSAGRPLGGGFGQRVRRIAQKYIGKRLHPHIFRHIIATHAAQCLKLTPTELAAFLAHRSPMTVMKFYEVTSPSLAAMRFDDLRN